MQLTSEILLLNTGSIMVLKPLSVGPIAPMPCIFLHVDTHLRHKIHLFASLTMEGDVSSIVKFIFSPSYLILSTPSFLERACSSQFSLLTQVKHLRSWFDSINSKLTFLASWIVGVLVFISMPSETGKTHEACSTLAPFTSTRHIRQAPISLIPLR